MTDLAAGARCAVHPGRAAAGVCARCGSYGCAECLAPTASGMQCAACRDLEGPGALDDFIARRRGRRDGLTWSVGLGGIGFYLYELMGMIGARYVYHSWHPTRAWWWITVGLAALGLLLLGAYLARVPFARWAVGVPLLIIFASVAEQTSGDVVSLLPPALVLGLVAYAWYSPLNRLAFGLGVPRAELARAWHAVRRNRLAWLALALSIPAAVAPFTYLGVVPVVATAWHRSREPQGRGKWRALIAALLCALGFAVTLWVVVRDLQGRLR